MKLVTQHLPAVLVCSILAMLAASPGAAQRWGTVEISPIAGRFVPTAQLPPDPNIGCLEEFGLLPCGSPRPQGPAVALGGRLTAWMNRWVALEGSLWYASNSVMDQFSPLPFGARTQTRDVPVKVLASDVRVMVSPIRSARLRAYVAAGPAFVDRSSDANGLSGNARFGGVVGAGAHLRVARSLAIRADVEQYRYSVYGYPKRAQRDILLSLGLSFASRITVGSAATP